MLPHDIHDKHIRLAPQPQRRFRRTHAGGYEQVRPMEHEMSVVEAPAVVRRHHQSSQPWNSNLAAVVMTGKDRRETLAAESIDIVRGVRQHKS